MPFSARASSVRGAIISPTLGISSEGSASSAASFANVSSSLATVIRTTSSALSRQTTTGTSEPIFVSATIRGKRLTLSISIPLNLRIMSCSLIPPSIAGPSFATEATNAPRALSRPNVLAISSVTVWICTPSHPLRVSPKRWS